MPSIVLKDKQWPNVAAFGTYSQVHTEQNVIATHGAHADFFVKGFLSATGDPASDYKETPEVSLQLGSSDRVKSQLAIRDSSFNYEEHWVDLQVAVNNPGMNQIPVSVFGNNFKVSSLSVPRRSAGVMMAELRLRISTSRVEGANRVYTIKIRDDRTNTLMDTHELIIKPW